MNASITSKTSNVTKQADELLVEFGFSSVDLMESDRMTGHLAGRHVTWGDKGQREGHHEGLAGVL